MSIDNNKYTEYSGHLVQKEQIKSQNLYLISSFALLVLYGYWQSRSAFSRAVSTEIREAAQGKCRGCGEYLGRGQGLTAHYDHERNGLYNDASNGRLLCNVCEVRYHYYYLDVPEMIGMTWRNNVNAVRGRFGMLSQEKQELLLTELGPEFRTLVS